GFSLAKSARKLIRKNRVKKIYYDPLCWSVADFKELSSKLSCNFTPQKKLSQKKRIIKSQEEIQIIKKAVKLGQESFESFAKFLQKEGFSKDEKCLHYKATDILSHEGDLSLSFDPIVAIDENGAKPHALPTKTKLKDNSVLLFDAGVKYKRYCSDRTRVLEFHTDKELNFSKEQRFASNLKQKVYDTVLKAQEEAMRFAKPGVKACEVDKVAREIIEKAGFGSYFIHSTGHGVGLDIHELPVISKRDETILQEGMIFTVEPGIYLPGEFGVRIEDMVLLTRNGAEIL
ncbi:MAG: aminopeptidase P family protein, partial [Epsilonproteobacteria bacterium]|nr:aminopeptidase P family protein [Campylobacterota bacterium]